MQCSLACIACLEYNVCLNPKSMDRAFLFRWLGRFALGKLFQFSPSGWRAGYCLSLGHASDMIRMLCLIVTILSKSEP